MLIKSKARNNEGKNDMSNQNDHVVAMLCHKIHLIANLSTKARAKGLLNLVDTCEGLIAEFNQKLDMELEA